MVAKNLKGGLTKKDHANVVLTIKTTRTTGVRFTKIKTMLTHRLWHELCQHKTLLENRTSKVWWISAQYVVLFFSVFIQEAELFPCGQSQCCPLSCRVGRKEKIFKFWGLAAQDHSNEKLFKWSSKANKLSFRAKTIVYKDMTVTKKICHILIDQKSDH